MYSPDATLGFNEETAGRLLVRDVPRAEPNQTCDQVLRRLREQRFEHADVLVVLDQEDRIVGVADISDVARSDPRTPIEEIMRSAPTATLDMDQEQVASLAIQNDLSSIAVLDDAGRFAGVIPARSLLAVLRREHIEDLHRLAGVARETALAREAIEGPPARRARHRLPWLLVGLAGSVLATLVMAKYEMAMQTRLVIAFFVPGIVYLADAMGTQTEAIVVRALSLSRLDMHRLIGGELSTGLIIGTVLGLLAGVGVWIATADPRLAFAVGAALLIAGTLATLIGMLLPWLFHRVGMDPAYGSGPLATVTQDVLSLFVYFYCVTAFLELRI